MKAKPLISSLMLILLMGTNLGAQSKRGRRPDSKQPATSPCGVHFQTFDEFVEERKIEWRAVSTTSDRIYYYNSRKIACNRGVLKVWIKAEELGKEATRQIIRYELNCRNNQMRTISITNYDQAGKVTKSIKVEEPEWDEVLPDSVGESILDYVCRKPLERQ